jgi:hypothetical protein
MIELEDDHLSHFLVTPVGNLVLDMESVGAERERRDLASFSASFGQALHTLARDLDR